MQLTKSTGKRVRASHDLFWFHSDWMKWRKFLQLNLDTQMKTALIDVNGDIVR